MVQTDSLFRSIAVYRRTAGTAGLFDQDLTSRRNPNLSVGHHTLAGLYSRFNHDEVLLLLAQCHRALLCGRVWLDDVFFFNDTATTEIYTLSLHDALPTSR